MYRVRVVIATLAATLVTVLGVSTAPHAGSAPIGVRQVAASDEAAFIAAINDLRASKGLATLTIDAELTEHARRWAEQMKQNGAISHAPKLSAGITADWRLLGENVGVGGDVAALMDAFIASPSHYENLINPEYRFVGVGVVYDGNRMYTTHRFMSLRPTPATAPPAERPDELAMAEPTTSTTSTTTTTTTPPPQPLATDPTRLGLVVTALGAYAAD